MKNGSGIECDLWVMVDHDGDRTLFQLVEVGNGSDVLRQARELHAPAVVVDMALPALPELDALPDLAAMPAKRHRPGNSRLILLNLRTVTGVDAPVVMRTTSFSGDAGKGASETKTR
jgi:hypothetical protein